MKVTVDANVFFAALIRSGLSRQILFHPDLDVTAPFFLLDEVGKYRSFLLAKSRLPPDAFDELMALMLSQVDLVSKNDLSPYVLPASKLISDSKDWSYLACALCVGSELVSNDAHLAEQNRVVVHTIDRLARKLQLIR